MADGETRDEWDRLAEWSHLPFANIVDSNKYEQYKHTSEEGRLCGEY